MSVPPSSSTSRRPPPAPLFVHPLADEWVTQIVGAVPSVLVAAVDTRLRLLVFNLAYRETLVDELGVEPRLGVPVPDLAEASPQLLDHMIAAWQHALAGHSFVTRGHQGEGPDSLRVFEFAVAPLLGPDGETVGATLVARDITALHHQEQALAELNARLEDRIRERTAELDLQQRTLQLALDTGQLGVWEVDLVAETTLWDERCRAICQAPRTLPFDDAIALIHPEDRDAVDAKIQHAMAPDTDDDFHYEKRVQRPDGSVRWVASHGCVQFDETTVPRRATRIVGVMQDITERKEREARLHDASEQKSRFLAMLGHELRTPLAAVAGAVELWRRLQPELDARLGRVRAVLGDQTRQLVRLVDDLLDVSRIARGKVQLECERIDALEPVRRAVAAAEADLQARGHRLELELPPTPAWLVADAARLEQIVVNLLTNAARYTPNGGTVRVTLYETETHIVIAVRDTGIGLTPEQQHWIFDAFRQGDQLEGGSGLGLGLSLVRQLVELHRGTIEVHSEGPQRGSTFVVRLPRTVPAHIAARH